MQTTVGRQRDEEGGRYRARSHLCGRGENLYTGTTENQRRDVLGIKVGSDRADEDVDRHRAARDRSLLPTDVETLIRTIGG